MPAPRTKPKTYNWDDYTAEAEAPDFVLTTADGEIRITNPTGARVVRLAQAMQRGDMDAMLLALTGDAYPEVNKLLATSGHKALPRLLEDLQQHFDMYDDVELVSPDGVTVKATTPKRIRELLALGYVSGGA